MVDLTENIDNQIEFNQGKNIFLDNLEVFQFAKETAQAIASIDRSDPASRQFLVNYATDKAIEEFCRINQYYSFDSTAKRDLRIIYAELFDNILAKTDSVEEISKGHYEKLRQWLKKSNPFAEEIYKNTGQKIHPVACSEYSPEIQIKLLQIDTRQLVEPVLDVGCGKHGNLVNFLLENGIEACGIDRNKFTDPYLTTADWLEYDFGLKKWGTIVSNLGFSNHFNHHNLRKDGKYIEYGKAYMNILHSLKIGGRFHYAPDLPFIEKYLDGDQFDLGKYEVTDYDFKTAVIKRKY